MAGIFDLQSFNIRFNNLLMTDLFLYAIINTSNEREVIPMKNEITAIVTRMVANGYALFNETIEQYVNRMIEYGFKVEDIRRFEENFMNYKK